MLIARAPLRISFAGGGTDLKAYYQQHGGLVVSTTIDKYVYVVANVNGSDSAQITSPNYQTFFRQRRGQPIRWDGDLSLPRAFLHHFGVDSGVSLFLASEVPPGTGLGSSSAVAVALATSLGTLCGLILSKADVAELASYVEIEKLGMPIGRQDQYAATFGGLNIIRLSADGIQVEPLKLPNSVERTLERRIMLFFTHRSRSAASILRDQQEASRQEGSNTVSSLHHLKAIARSTIEALQSGDLSQFGSLLDESWQAKKQLAKGITDRKIDEWYDLALASGARGGKIAGAGGGGFLMLYCDEPAQASVTTVLEAAGLRRMDFHFERGGAVVLLDPVPRIRLNGSFEGVTAELWKRTESVAANR